MPPAPPRHREVGGHVLVRSWQTVGLASRLPLSLLLRGCPAGADAPCAAPAAEATHVVYDLAVVRPLPSPPPSY